MQQQIFANNTLEKTGYQLCKAASFFFINVGVCYDWKQMQEKVRCMKADGYIIVRKWT